MISHPRHDEEYARPPRYHHGPPPQPSTPSGFEDIDFSGDRSGTAVTPLAAWHGPDGRSHGDSQPTQGRGIQQSKILDPPPNVNRIQKRRHSFSKEKGGGGVAGNGTVLSFDYPDDESSTFIRGRNRLRWFSARLMRHARKIMETMARRMEGVVVLLRRKVDPTKVALTGLASLALMFMDFGIASRAPSPIGNGYGAWQARTSTSPEGMPSHHSERRSGGGYQARGQVPIPLEYASFVELSEFADAVMVVRAHRQKILKQQNHHGRRLDEAGKGSDGTGQNDANAGSVERGSKRNRGRGKNRNNEGGFEGKTDEASIKETGDQNDVAEATRVGEKDNEEISNMNNAIEDAWEQAMQANPDLGSGQEKGLESTKVAHVPFFWHVNTK